MFSLLFDKWQERILEKDYFHINIHLLQITIWCQATTHTHRKTETLWVSITRFDFAIAVISRKFYFLLANNTVLPTPSHFGRMDGYPEKEVLCNALWTWWASIRHSQCFDSLSSRDQVVSGVFADFRIDSINPICFNSKMTAMPINGSE